MSPIHEANHVIACKLSGLQPSDIGWFGGAKCPGIELESHARLFLWFMSPYIFYFFVLILIWKSIHKHSKIKYLTLVPASDVLINFINTFIVGGDFKNLGGTTQPSLIPLYFAVCLVIATIILTLKIACDTRLLSVEQFCEDFSFLRKYENPELIIPRLTQFYKYIGYLKNGKWYRFLMVLIISLWLSFGVFKTGITPIEKLNIINTSGAKYRELPNTTVSLDELNPANLPSIYWKYASKMPGQRVCFVNNGSHIEYDNKKDYEAYKVKISFNGRPYQNLSSYDKICNWIPIGENKFIFTWRFETELVFPQMLHSEPEKVPINETHYMRELAEIIFRPRVNSYIVPSPLTEVLKFFIIFFSTGSVIWAWSRTFVFIRDGI